MTFVDTQPYWLQIKEDDQKKSLFGPYDLITV